MVTPAQVPAMLVAADPDLFDDALDEQALDAEDTVEENLRYEITSYGADYDVDGLVKRLQNGDIKIPEFQRGFVWPIRQASRFIESLLLGLPVPGIFLSKEPETNKLLVIDGQQRLTTLQAFYDGIWPTSKKEFALTDVQQGLVGKTFKTLEEVHRRVLQDSIVHATVVKQTDPQDGGSGIYKIFERLNSSGMLLSPQEIRTAIYGGSFAKLLSDLNQNKNWRLLFGPINKRMRDQELVLRFFALMHDEAAYARPMKSFLNTFMNKNKELSIQTSNEFTAEFVAAVELVSKAIGPKVFKPTSSFNAAVFDSVLVGIARRLQKGPITDPALVGASYWSLLEDNEFTAATSRSTANDETVKTRLEKAIAAFDGLI
jgi:hypothetical protein